MTTTFTVSDGTDTLQVAVEVPPATLAPAVDALPDPVADDPFLVTGRVPSYLEGGVTLTVVAGATLVIPIALAGSAAVVVSAVADLSTPARLAGGIELAVTASADLSVGVYVEPSAEPFVNVIASPVVDEPFTVSGVVPPWAVLEGGASVSVAATGDLVTLTLAGGATVEVGAAAELTAQATHALSGDIVVTVSAMLASGTHTTPVVTVYLSTAERTVNLHHGRVDAELSASERTVILERRAA